MVPCRYSCYPAVLLCSGKRIESKRSYGQVQDVQQRRERRNWRQNTKLFVQKHRALHEQEAVYVFVFKNYRWSHHTGRFAQPSALSTWVFLQRQGTTNIQLSPRLLPTFDFQKVSRQFSLLWVTSNAKFQAPSRWLGQPRAVQRAANCAPWYSHLKSDTFYFEALSQFVLTHAFLHMHSIPHVSRPNHPYYAQLSPTVDEMKAFEIRVNANEFSQEYQRFTFRPKGTFGDGGLLQKIIDDTQTRVCLSVE